MNKVKFSFLSGSIGFPPSFLLTPFPPLNFVRSSQPIFLLFVCSACIKLRFNTVYSFFLFQSDSAMATSCGRRFVTGSGRKVRVRPDIPVDLSPRKKGKKPNAISSLSKKMLEKRRSLSDIEKGENQVEEEDDVPFNSDIDRPRKRVIVLFKTEADKMVDIRRNRRTSRLSKRRKAQQSKVEEEEERTPWWEEKNVAKTSSPPVRLTSPPKGEEKEEEMGEKVGEAEEQVQEVKKEREEVAEENKTPEKDSHLVLEVTVKQEELQPLSATREEVQDPPPVVFRRRHNPPLLPVQDELVYDHQLPQQAPPALVAPAPAPAAVPSLPPSPVAADKNRNLNFRSPRPKKGRGKEEEGKRENNFGEEKGVDAADAADADVPPVPVHGGIAPSAQSCSSIPARTFQSEPEEQSPSPEKTSDLLLRLSGGAVRCAKCQLDFSEGEDAAEAHLAHEHVCPFCFRTFKTRMSKLSHTRSAHPEEHDKQCLGKSGRGRKLKKGRTTAMAAENQGPESLGEPLQVPDGTAIPAPGPGVPAGSTALVPTSFRAPPVSTPAVGVNPSFSEQLLKLELPSAPAAPVPGMRGSNYGFFASENAALWSVLNQLVPIPPPQLQQEQDQKANAIKDER